MSCMGLNKLRRCFLPAIDAPRTLLDAREDRRAQALLSRQARHNIAHSQERTRAAPDLKSRYTVREIRSCLTVSSTDGCPLYTRQQVIQSIGSILAEVKTMPQQSGIPGASVTRPSRGTSLVTMRCAITQHTSPTAAVRTLMSDYPHVPRLETSRQSAKEGGKPRVDGPDICQATYDFAE